MSNAQVNEESFREEKWVLIRLLERSHDFIVLECNPSDEVFSLVEDIEKALHEFYK